MAVTVFIDDDPGYLRWLEGHPGGWVLNCHVATPAGRGTSFLVHRSSCRRITGVPAHGDTRTAGDYLKACGEETDVTRVGVVLGKHSPDRYRHCL